MVQMKTLDRPPSYPQAAVSRGDSPPIQLISPFITMKLTPKQEKFCQEYIVDLNGTQAAILASYSTKAAYSTADKLLNNPDIQAKISELRQQQIARTEINADFVLQGYSDIASFRIEDVVAFDGSQVIFKPMAEWTSAARAAVSSIKLDKNGNIEIKTNSKLAALDSLAKHLGLFGDFNCAISTLRQYDLELQQTKEGKWFLRDTSL
jgi:phage terminase small subunit